MEKNLLYRKIVVVGLFVLWLFAISTLLLSWAFPFFIAVAILFCLLGTVLVVIFPIENKDIFREFVVIVFLFSCLPAIPFLLWGWSITEAIELFFPIPFLFGLLGAVLRFKFPKIRGAIWIGMMVGTGLVNLIIFFFLAFAQAMMD